MRAAILLALVTIPALLLQTTILPLIAIGNATPDLLLIICVYLGLHLHSIAGAVGAFALGYLQDTFSGGTIGLNAFAMCLVFTVVYLTSRRLWVDNAVSKIVVVFLASLLKTTVILMLVALFVSVKGLGQSMLGYLIPEALLAAVFTPAVFALLARTQVLTVTEEE
ncbi:MAG TPA: rod shape-determining protein MreD [Terriglobales bacterium]|nr:rod shape-determining protein MreD [Terriglobales bacterium]